MVVNRGMMMAWSLLSVLSHSRAKEGKNAGRETRSLGRDAETRHGQRVKQRLVAGFDECNANVRCKEELVQKDTMRLGSGKQMETDGETDVKD